MNSPVKYDYIIAGTGCAGLSLAVHLIKSKKFAHRKVLLIDKEEKQKNDRTWCFWERKENPFESIVKKKWSKAWVHSNAGSTLLDLNPYQYKLIRGIDFYDYCLRLIGQHSNFHFEYGNIQEIKSDKEKGWVKCNDQVYTADIVFNSILFNKPVLQKKEYWLLQHFKGWIIETEKDVFNPGEATLMDFRVPQTHGTSFVYIMPFSTNRALVEYTLFTGEILSVESYDQALKDYIEKHLNTGTYNITEEELGVIPMTNHKFPAVEGRVINIGTAGGQTKASSGYTFQFIQKHSARLTESLIKKNNPFIPLPTGPARFRFYDSVLLRILHQRKLPGHQIFTRLFFRNKPAQVLRFLDNESRYADEIKIISSLPTWPFLKAAIKQL